MKYVKDKNKMSRSNKIENLVNRYIERHIKDRHLSESANLVKLYEQKQIANDVVFEMIFHPNGNLNGSWVDNEDILLAYNSYKS